MTIHIVYETHSISEDNERGIASGWNHSRLSERGRTLAQALGERRLRDGIQAVFVSDLERAVETARIAFANSAIPIFHDWRLRECNYGKLNGMPAAQVHGERELYLDEPYPVGESWRQAVARVGRFLPDLHEFSKGSPLRVLVIGHVATRWALDHFLNGVMLEDMVHADFAWREGWEYAM
jgi:2,3-bisphosphoglycerate-dependent phosphoglycerate mutase